MARIKKNIRSFIPEGDVSFRAIEEDGKKYLIGYASVFNQKSKLIYERGKYFFEIIDPKAFDEVLADEKLDVPLTFNHSRDKLIARTISNTLTLSTDEKGLLFKAELPNVSYANDVYELVLRGDLFENSFGYAFTEDGIVWSKDEDGNNLRTINKINKLLDVSVVTNAAFSNTFISARDDEELKDEERIEPQPGDDKDDYISKCVKYVIDNGETDDPKQATAICNSKWDKREEEKREALKQEIEKLRMHIKTLKLKK
jgi:uncharacterized protein